MGFFRQARQRQRITELEQNWSEASNGWNYILKGLIIANKARLETTISLGDWLKDLNGYWAMSPLVRESTAGQFAAKYGLPSFYNHTGVGYTCDEFFQLLSKALVQKAGYTQRELSNSTEVEQTIDKLNAENGVADFIEMIYPSTHTQKPSRKASYKTKLETSIMIGDILNLLGYHYNEIANSKNPTAKKLYDAMIDEVARDGSLTKDEKVNIVSVVENGIQDINAIVNQ